MQKIDLRNQKFGHLTVLYEVPKEQRRTLNKVAWMCQCDCGNRVVVSACKLRGGEQLSCGHKCQFYKENFIKDLTRQRFGLLTAIKDSGQRQGRVVIWECKCDCGKTVLYSGQTLQKGRALSCGCLKESYGEFKINQILIENNISFEREKTFDTCRFPDTNKLARFDFYINNNYLIEFDGSQHFVTNNYKWNTPEKLQLTQAHDTFKTRWCKENNIPLIRIPYTHIKEIDIKDLLLKSTPFREV